MSKWKLKRKQWLDRKSRKGNQQKRHKLRVTRLAQNGELKASYINSDSGRQIVTITPPKEFSIVNNPEETMQFFIDFAEEIDRKQYGKRFFINSSEVEKVTVDALIYLIAILQNDSLNRTMRYTFTGNYPQNQEAFRIYAESGFNDYVVSRMRILPKSNDKMSIICGEDNSPQAAKQFSTFVMEKLGKTRVEIQPLQKVLIELMSNVYYHAYEKNLFLAKKWYMYAENVDNYIRCIFVDTGYGIAKTVRKNFAEKMRLLFGFKVDDARIIRSVFDGDFRTATNERFRGNGLSSVRENVKSDLFEAFEVISGRGRCIIPKDDDQTELLSVSYKKYLFGTLYQFVIR